MDRTETETGNATGSARHENHIVINATNEVQPPLVHEPMEQARTHQICRPMTEFTDFVAAVKRKCVGTDGTGQQQPFIPYADLDEFWDNGRINTVLASCKPHLPYSAESIRSRCLRIFSLLVYENLVSSLDVFMTHDIGDYILAQDISPEHMHEALSSNIYKPVRKAIRRYQWLFYPIAINPHELSNLRLCDHRVLPFTIGDVVSENDSATIRKVNVLESHKSLTKKTYILKTYSNRASSRYFNELEAFNAVRPLKNEHIVRHYGSFRQNNTFNLVLQFVDGVHLGKYFEETPKPVTPSQARQFWSSMWPIWKGIHGLHQTQLKNGTNPPYIGVHQDLKLDNILIARGNSDSSYEFVPILTDFGHSYFRPMRQEHENGLVPDRHGNQEFASPEASHHAAYLQFAPARITPDADIWSMGCILSVSAAWVTLGLDGIRQYESLRRQETSQIPNFEDAGHHGCFHNGTERLTAVDTMHTFISNQCNGDDSTKMVIDLLTSSCIVGDPTARKSARVLHEYGPQWPPSPGGERPPVDSPVSSAANDHITIEQCDEWVNAKTVRDQAVGNAIRCLQQQLNGREYIFLIDDTPHMEKYRAEVKNAFRILASIAKPMDPNRVELIFASHPGQVHKLNNRWYSTFAGTQRRVLEAFDNCKYNQIPGHLEKNLNPIVTSITSDRLIARSCPTSLFIFTDGQWGEDNEHACGVQWPIKRLIDFTRKRNDRTQIMVQFIRFGDNAQGKRHLDYLDTFGKMSGWDIVDHKPITGNVLAMFSGSISHQSDLEGEQ